MDQPQNIRINLDEEFPHLTHAPIVEAIIHWQARVERNIKPADLRKLESELPDYPERQAQHHTEFELKQAADGSSEHAHRAIWHGFHCVSRDKLYVAQFTRNGFVLSRLEPYEDWERFRAEALRLWNIYLELAQPSLIQRLGVRFINRIAPVDLHRLGDVLKSRPACPPGFDVPLKGFMHQSMYEIYGHDYNVNFISAFQAPTPQLDKPGLILDVDVFTTKPVEVASQDLPKKLAEMRWIKNKVFFASLTETAIDSFR